MMAAPRNPIYGPTFTPAHPEAPPYSPMPTYMPTPAPKSRTTIATPKQGGRARKGFRRGN